MILPRGVHTMVKTRDFFLEQNGDTREWGKTWVLVEAPTLDLARLYGSLMEPEHACFKRLVLEHIRQKCPTDCGQCNLCNLFYCQTCGTFEGGMPSECPGRLVGLEDSMQVYQGLKDFRAGIWTTAHRSKYMYPQDAYCQFCRGENPHFKRDFFTKDFSLWHQAKDDGEIVVQCEWPSAMREINHAANHPV